MADAGDAEQRPVLSLLGDPGVVQRIACAAFAWAVTVAPAVVVRSGTWPADGSGSGGERRAECRVSR